MKTYLELRQAGAVTFPAAVTEDLKATIADWFDHREVCDDVMFNVFFNRLLNRDLPRYNQLLRIEPGISEYDWLVQNYREKERNLTESGTNGRTVENDGTDTVVETLNSKQKQRTFLNTDTKTNNNVTETDTAVSGTLKRETEYGRTSTNGNAQDGKDYSTKNEHEITGKLVNKSTDNTNVSQRSLAKASPQSASYGSGNPPTQAGMPAAFDWAYPGSQSESETKGNGGNTTSETYGADNYKETDTVTVTDKRKVTLGGKDTTTETDTRVHNKVLTGNVANAHTGTITDVETGGETKARTLDTLVTERGNNSKTGLDRMQESGRNVDIATLLSNAKGFIMSTNAWIWLAGQLETVFMGIYD